MIPSPVVEHYRIQQRLQLATVAAVRSQWARMSPEFDASWSTVGRRITLIVTAGQLGSARNGSAYIAPTLATLDTPDEPAGSVRVAAFAGVASSGADLAETAHVAVIRAKQSVGAGEGVPEALAAGGRWLDTFVSTQLADAARGAAGVEIALRPTMGYTRMLSPPSCSRCAILAGAFYRYNAGFERHLNCDCRHIPCTEDRAADLRTDPDLYFKSLDRAQQDKIFTQSGAEAIRDGANIGRVVNARSGAYGLTPAGARITDAEKLAARGGKQRGHLATQKVFGGRDVYTTTARSKSGTRLMPESIYSLATDRDDAIRLLRKFGYIF